jgi:acyl carrier protein
MKYEIPTPRTGDSILQDLVEMLTDLTSDWDRGLGGPIGAKTRLVADLGFDSVDDVQVAIAIEEQFQRRKLPFEKLLMVDGR